jgi:hypothetical protein
MTPEQIQQIIDFLKQISTTIAQKGYEIFYQQVYFNYIWSIFWIAFTFVLSVSVIFVHRGIVKWLNKKYAPMTIEEYKKMYDHVYQYQYNDDLDPDKDTRNMWIKASLFLSIAIWLLSLVTIIIDMKYVVNFLINPNWLVIQLVINNIPH